VGILIGLSRLASDSEVTAMRATGVGTVTFLKITSIFGIVAWVLALVNNAAVAPFGRRAGRAHQQPGLFPGGV